MTEVPEHLRKRAEEARKKAEAKAAGGEAAPAAAPEAAAPAADAAAPAGESKIPAHLLERSKAAREKSGGAAAAASGGGTATAVATTPAAGGAVPAVAGPAPTLTGPGGHTQRLLTVVKSGSIQDVKATPQDKVHTWPHLLVVEFGAALACTSFLLFFSIFVNAPFLELADVNQTPNPSKAPWYFLGLQELLTMFHPMVAGVTIPGMGIFLLTLAPYIDKNPSNKPEHRKFAISLMTVHLMFWATLVMIGSFFRGPGFNFVFPWQSGIFFEL
ncbi:MAG TPA: menaquinol-cytochrome c reductase cytochrome b subunit [Acidimicrobiales bacterium]|nr:menaquinol-cytochrome c reductase cytochrome b subunit [Acidimicrobiales bacterium]